ncbi:hypothetical protein GCM10010981_11300 [Dyella nitratireducens]|uniref:Uncharacterized protein n=1 Tax=Dyella nitratireducens TaxID=1849580 RepID=A0ABQ1FQS3_9GAMM|nr:hypothetical protein GCM10010981_11300 [Dyella nitratireducens]GLQ43807.1 hypothetical protein GCM10007902_36570 [Dyella nitratireducens]
MSPTINSAAPSSKKFGAAAGISIIAKDHPLPCSQGRVKVGCERSERRVLDVAATRIPRN